jgi:hypothetical protein
VAAIKAANVIFEAEARLAWMHEEVAFVRLVRAYEATQKDATICRVSY